MRYATIVADPPWPYEGRALPSKASGWKGPAIRRAGDFCPYPTMTIEEIAAIPVYEWALPGAHIYLWTTNRFLWGAADVLRSWGFTPATICVWCKAPMGQGAGSDAFANTTEWFVWGRKRFGEAILRRRLAVGLSQGEFARLVLGDPRNRLVQQWEADACWPRPENLERICEVLEWSTADFVGPPKHRWDRSWFQWPRGAHSQKPEAFLDLVEETSPGPYLELFARRQRLGWDTWGDEALNHVELAS